MNFDKSLVKYYCKKLKENYACLLEIENNRDTCC